MTFYLIGLGLNLKSISLEALEILKRCKRVYIENYTVEFPYKIQDLERVVGKIIPLTRIMIENEKFVEEGKNKNIALLIYGSPLIATTHISLILKCKKEKIDYKVIHNSSIFDAVSETGLQIYKFGKTASMPKWDEKHKPDSFIDVIKFNQAVKAHSLILVDIGLSFNEALTQLGKASRGKFKLNKIIVCSKLGTSDSKIYYDEFKDLLGAEVHVPFCFIIPAKLHFMEEEALEKLS